jgi:ribokinase
VDTNTSTFVPIEEKVHAVDTTGAGDCFLGCFAFFVAQGIPISECMRRANKAAGLSVTRLGTQTSFPTSNELPTEWFSSFS